MAATKPSRNWRNSWCAGFSVAEFVTWANSKPGANRTNIQVRRTSFKFMGLDSTKLVRKKLFGRCVVFARIGQHFFRRLLREAGEPAKALNHVRVRGDEARWTVLCAAHLGRFGDKVPTGEPPSRRQTKRRQAARGKNNHVKVCAAVLERSKGNEETAASAWE